MAEVHNLQELRQSASLATKVFIQRDYTDGILCQFQTKFPPELESRVERHYFEDTVKTLNSYYAEAEKIGGTSYFEGCLACITAYIIFICMETRYEKVLKKISKYIQEQNEKIYTPRGLLITDPIERGLRVKKLFYPETSENVELVNHSFDVPEEKLAKYIREKWIETFIKIEIAIYEDRCSSGSSSSSGTGSSTSSCSRG